MTNFNTKQDYENILLKQSKLYLSKAMKAGVVMLIATILGLADIWQPYVYYAQMGSFFAVIYLCIKSNLALKQLTKNRE